MKTREMLLLPLLLAAGPTYAQDITLVEQGRDLFMNETFGGNGRTCRTCHDPTDNFTINPATIARLPADDPLFVPNVANFENPVLLALGLFEENQDGFDQVPNFRASMPVSGTGFVMPDLNNSIGAHLENLGWTGDGAPTAPVGVEGALRDFATGAVIQHFPRTLEREVGVDFRLPTDEELDAIAAFLLQLQIPAPDLFDDAGNSNVNWSIAAVRRGAELFSANRCNFCHNDTGGNTPAGVNLLVDTGVEDGAFSRGTDSRTAFNSQPLNNVLAKEKFFHANNADSLLEAIAFYSTPDFNNSPAGQAGAPINLTDAENLDIERFLRAVNVMTNIAQYLNPRVGEIPLEELEDAFLLTPFEWTQQKASLGIALGFAERGHERQARRFAQRAFDSFVAKKSKVKE